MGGTSESCIEYEQRFDRVRYLGSVGINKSLLPFPPEHRELIVSAAIHKLFNETDLDVPPTPILAEIDQLPHSTLHEILGETRIARNPRARATTRVTTKNIEISTVESQSNAGFFTDRLCMLAHHQMDVISFASLDMSVYVSYVAKDTGMGGVAVDDSRACHVIECEHTAQANDMYAAVESAFNQRTRQPITVMKVPESFSETKSRWDDTLPQGVHPDYYNTDPNKEAPLSGRIRQPMPDQALYANQRTIDEMMDLQSKPIEPKPIPNRISERSNYVNQDVVDEHNMKIRNSSTESMSPSPNSVFANSAIPSSSSTSSFGSSTFHDEDSDQIRRLRDIVQSARILEYFHSFPSNPRKAVEDKLRFDGDFLLREASVFLIPNQIRNITLSVLNMVKGKPIIKHVLLIMSPTEDAENPIHTLDKSFSSIAELIEHYMQDERTLQMPRDVSDHEEGDIKISNPIKRNIFIQKPYKNENLYV